MRLEKEYFKQDALFLAEDLLGKFLCRKIDGNILKFRITETECYLGKADSASHASRGKTARNKIMFKQGGYAYIYLCYGIHSLFNVVTNTIGIPHAVLIRAIHPLEGVEIMLKRAKRTQPDKTFGKGPGKVSKILGIHYTHSGSLLTRSYGSIWIEDHQIRFPADAIKATPRIGIDYAGADAALPYRFVIE